MATHSGGVDWCSIVKPLLANNNGNLNKIEITNIVKAITRCENDIFDEEGNNGHFYTAFSALAADTISQCSLVCQAQVPQILEASAVLIRFILNKLGKASVFEIKWLLPPLKSLCENKASLDGSNTTLPSVLKFDHNMVVSILKSTKFPEVNKSIVTSGDKESPKAEIKRSRSDLSSVILQQLTLPLEVGNNNWTPLSEELTDCSEILSSANITYLRSLNAADSLLDVCTSLPILTRYRHKYEDTVLNGKPLYLPLSHVEATQIKNTLVHIVADISILCQALSLPILSPLSPSRITKLSQCAISALYCAVLTSISSSILSMSTSSAAQKAQQQQMMSSAQSQSQKEADESEEHARFIVDKALEIYTTIGNMFNTLARAHIYQNHLCFGAWLLVSGIQGALGASGSSTATVISKPTISHHEDQKAKTGSRQSSDIPATPARVNLFKVQQGFGVLNAAIAKHSLKLLAELIDDLKIESTCNDTGLMAVQHMPEPADFNILDNYSSLQRVVRVLNTATLNQLYTFLATVSYRKACALKRASTKDRAADCDPISYSDSTTYFNDTLSCSDNSEEDDSESYLGLWFKETLSPETIDDMSNTQPQDGVNEPSSKSNLVPAIDEPHEYLHLAAQIFCFLDRSFGSKHAYLLRYAKAGLSDQQMLLLANILKDLDRDAARGETETAVSNEWQAAMIYFSGSVGRYLHNLISAGMLNESLQSNLLLHLSVSPWSTECNSWPLQVYSSTLSVLVQILLLKPTQEKEAACLSVWHRMINTLVEGVCSTTSSSATTSAISTADTDFDDLNMEHAQLLIFLFHSLNLMQKKSILLLTAGGVIRCAEVCRSITYDKPLRNSQIMLLSRLLLFLEYLMKHLYNAPTALLEQVRWNLFSINTMDENQKVSDLLNSKTQLTTFCRKDIEDKFRKSSSDCLTVIRPIFYSLTLVDGQIVQDFKLDGLAWNFILCTPDKLKYPLLVDALIDILSVTDVSLNKASSYTLCGIRYCFSICWKLLLGLPPSTSHVESLLEDKVPNLHSLLWSIRCPLPSSHYLIVNSLIKQGMYTQFAETLWSNVTDRVSDIRFRLKQTILSVDMFNRVFDAGKPRVSHILLLDAILSHMYAIACAEEKGIQLPGAGCSDHSDVHNARIQNIEQSTSFSQSSSASIIDESHDSNKKFTEGGGWNGVSVKEREKLSRELLLLLIDTFELISDTIKVQMIEQISNAVTPRSILNLIIPIVGSNNPFVTELNPTFLQLLPKADKETIINEWPICLEVVEHAFVAQNYPVEEYTLTVIEAQIAELTKNANYSHLNSLKHTMKPLLNLIYFLLPHGGVTSIEGDSTDLNQHIEKKLKPILIASMSDIRMEYVSNINEKCCEILLDTDGTSDVRQFLAYVHYIKYCYKLLLAYAAEMRQTSEPHFTFGENLFLTIIQTMSQLLDKPMGLKAMHSYFKVQNEGSLVELLLSFSGTSTSQLYATKILQFIEKLFQIIEKDGTYFPKQDLVQCFFSLEYVEIAYLKTWLSHVIYGPGSGSNVVDPTAVDTVDKATSPAPSSSMQPSSTSSSNAQTPTNMATVSAVPSITDQVAAQSSTAVDADAEAMEIDDDGASAAGGNTAVATAQAQSLSLWHTAGNSYFTNLSDASSHDEDAPERNGALLLSVIKHIVDDKNVPKGVSMVFFQSLLELGQSLLSPPQETLDFSDILQIMITLADAAQGRGHATLFNATIIWLEVTQSHVLDKSQSMIANSQWTSSNKPQIALENITALLRYMCDLLQSLGYKGSKNMTPPWEDDMQNTDLEDYMDEMMGGGGAAEDEDSIMEDSDEDSLGNKLCTFSQTQKEFMNQHWYHCHTCNMVNTVGVCSVCARVCHKNHDVSYAKYGNFFCDCGAKEDGSCQALSKRVATAATIEGGALIADGGTQNTSGMQRIATDNLDTTTETSYNQAAFGINVIAGPKKHSQLPSMHPFASTNAIGVSCVGAINRATGLDTGNVNERILHLAKVIAGSREILLNVEQWSSVVHCILDFFDILMPSIRDNCALFSIIGCHRRAKSALERLHTPEPTFQLSEQLMVPTLGSQEGAFENVRMSYSGDQGQTIKQLLSSGLVRRVALCCLSSPYGKRQHLAVSHEKGKVTILQLSALLKQADAAKRKLTLTQLSSAPIPCTVLSLAANPSNEDCLAVCGLKECHILTLANTGIANDHIVLTPQLENGNFIKKAIWLPGSQTMLALVTADYVKIYELAEDAYSPKYYFLVAVGKIRDCTFVYQQGGFYYMFLIASSGYIYYQLLDDVSLAKHGDFYVTNTLDLHHPHIKDVNGQVGGGGVSIYYSHTLQILFFSYSLGRSFMAPLTDVNSGVLSVMQLQTGPPSTKNSSKGPPQPLCQWTEIAGHPGLICAMMHTSNNPVIFMLTPERILMQEIKAQSSKSKIMDMVAIRHTVSGVEKTTLILLCEDGSLRIFTAQPENTNYWLTAQVQPIGNQMYSSTMNNKVASANLTSAQRKSKRSNAGGKTSGANMQKLTSANGSPIFPIDFFEHCTMLLDVEFGGNDLLQIYNKQKLKTRLFSTGMFVASTKPTGFTLEIYNSDPNTVIVGIRVLLGTQDLMRAPQNVSVHGRTIPTPVRRARWFDIPLTREEILQSDKRLNVVFGKSQDPENVCMLDSIEVYGKSKDLIGWPEDNEEAAVATVGGTVAANATTGSATGGTLAVAAVVSSATPPTVDGHTSITNLDKMVTILLEVLDSALALLGGNNVGNTSIKQRAIKTATTLLLMPTPNPVQLQAKCVLATLFGNRTAYHNFKDYEILNYVNTQLQAMKPKITCSYSIGDIDPEDFYRLVLLIRSIATTRPQALTKISLDHGFEIVANLILFSKQLHAITPKIDEPTSIVKRGLCHTVTIVHSLVEIMYAFALSDINQVEPMTKYLIDLLLDESTIISHSAKEAIVLLLSPRVKRRKVAIVSSPVCSTPTPATLHTITSAVNAPNLSAMLPLPAAVEDGDLHEEGEVNPSNNAEFVNVSGGASLDPLNAHDASGQLLNIEAIMGGGFPQLLGLPQDADDEAIMDIAIALSLQQHDSDGAGGGSGGLHSLQQGLANLQGLRIAASGGTLDGGLVAANTASSVSVGGSDDDEGSNAATDGSTLRTSPAEPVGSGGSESGGSGVESIGGTSGRSSTYGDSTNVQSAPLAENQLINKTVERPSTSAAGGGIGSFEQSQGGTNIRQTMRNSSTENEENLTDDVNCSKLHELRCTVLTKFVENLNTLESCHGNQSIPLIQVILMLTTDLNGNNEMDQQILNNLLTALVQYLGMNPIFDAIKLTKRNASNEVKLMLLCLFGVLMGKTKSSSSKQAGTTSPPHQFKDNASFVAATTANIIIKSGILPYCLVIMESLLPHWKKISNEQNAAGTNNANATSVVTPPSVAQPALSPTQNSLLKPVRYGPKPDMSTLIPHNYLKNFPNIFEAYDGLLTEVAVRLPYQILKLSASHPATFDWYHKFCERMTFILCEYMMLNLNTLLRRQVRKLLMYICGNKEKFRMFRDGHSLDVHINAIKTICKLQNTKTLQKGGAPFQSMPILTYDSLVELTEHLRSCQEISQIRTGNWQKFCIVHEDVIPDLIQIACYQLDDGVSPILLQLLQAALCNNNQAVKQQQQQQQQQQLPGTSAKSRSERDKSEENEITCDSKFDSSHCSSFVHQIFRFVPDALINKFIKVFLLETNITSIRWQAHSLLFAIYENCNERQKEKLIGILWNMWQFVPAFGRRTAQFVDILGYLTLSTKSIVQKLPEYTEKAVEVLRQQNELLSRHPNAPIYATLEQILQVNGYYLESEPCLVCNNPEVPMTNIKLPSIKSDSKFTTTTMIVKLVQSHTISKLIVRIADLKRTKMVRSINIFYNNRTVQAVVELKNRPAMWHKARSVTLQSGQTEVKIDFPLPITACNLMIEYADFYETVTGSSENLQCPRCSAAVPAYPGVCANCGENVFQCHKCRAINYDEKDPFLCHSCGFCKYAKFDFSIYGRVCCAVDPIESAEDRAKTVVIINTSLDRADRIYRQLQTNKQMLELLIQKVAEHRYSDRLVDDNLGTIHSTSQVNKIIQLLAQKYCMESRSSFEELSKIVQKVKACRSELIAYDRSQIDQLNNQQTLESRDSYAINRCYGCALASTEQCLTLLRAMASNYECRIGLYSQGLVEELAQNNLRRGTPQIQDEVRNLLVLLTKNNKEGCLRLLQLISERVKTALLGAIPLANLDSALYHEMVLLEVLIAQDDFCWEEKLKVVFELFLITCRTPRGPAISVIQPCLRIMQALICPQQPISKLNKDLSPAELSTITTVDGITIDFNKWLEGYKEHSFNAWKARMPPNNSASSNGNSGGGGKSKKLPFGPQEDRVLAAVLKTVLIDQIGSAELQEDGGESLRVKKRALTREAYLIEKYGRRWRQHTLGNELFNTPLHLGANWIQPIIFNANSRFGRQLACSLITSLSRTHERKREILNLLTGFLKYVGEAGEASAEFLALYRALAADTPWRQYLVLKGVLTEITQLLADEIVKIHHLEETTLSSDLSQGYALRQLVELLSLFLESSTIRQSYKTRLLGPVLKSYLSLRKLVVQRARLIDDAQEKLLEMLEEMTSGTEEETRAFMEILIDTVERTRMDDIKTPVFIFERLYSIIHPEENDESEFFMTLEKDPQQEDFLQGRMLGNPYSSTEVGLGPLMRDVKNKICTDCELIALLEDDNGMELLVNNKIISLDLPVKDVYKKVWLAEGGERDAMRVVYRMRGLLGDATEEFVETLNNKSQEEIDTEQLYRMANVLADCNGLKVMLNRIGSFQNISRTRELTQVLLKLFLICVKVRRCQEVLCQPELGAINTLLKVLQMCLQSENDLPIQSSVTEQLLEIMETILSKAASDTLDSFLQFSLTFGGPEYVSALISCTNCSNVRNNPSVLRHLIRVLAALVYGNEVKMALLCEHFKDTLDFIKFDGDRTPEDEFKMELFCVLTNQIEHNCIGGTLKDYIVGLGIVEKAITYITKYAPCVKPTLLRTDSDELKEFISRPSLKYILRFLTGLGTKHEATQIAISNDIIPIIHRLEQVSSDEHVGSLAENLLEALCTDAATATRVQEVRDFTRTEKKRLAMATREKQLDALGMRTNEKGQVTAKGSILQKIEKLRDETGLTCFICREGYACQPAKVLGIYTFSKRTNVEDFELKTRKTIGYTTVTHFNVVHVDCHTSAIRLARGRDEWERASLQNANTRCNGLLPLWGPEVSEAAFSACMTRHSSYMQESTQRCEISFTNSVHDLKLLLMRFAWEKSFHDDAGGGGPQSNMHFVPYLLFYAVYLQLSSRSAARDNKTLLAYLTAVPSEKWLECGYDVEGPLFLLTLSLTIHSHETWNKNKVAHLKRMIAIAHARAVSPSGLCKALLSPTEIQTKDFSIYRPFVMMWAIVDLIYNILFKAVVNPKEEDWSISLFDYIRKNDEAMLRSTDAILQTFSEDFLPCTSFAEFCDVADLLNIIDIPEIFVEEVLLSLPSSSTT